MRNISIGKISFHHLSFYFFLSWLCVLSILVTAFDKGFIFLEINHYRNSILDIVLSNATLMGDGIFAIAVILICALWKPRQRAWTLLASFLLSGIICIIIKNIVNAPRPALYFDMPGLVQGVNWMPLSKYHSFPSGHTTSAFSIASVLWLTTKNKWSSLLYVLLACIVGYSRVYLGQHFVTDIFAGSILGAVCGYLCVLKSDTKVIRQGLGIEYILQKLHKRKISTKRTTKQLS